MDLTKAEVVFIVTQNPSILHASLSNHIIPSLKTLQSVAGNDRNAVAILKGSPYVLTNNPRSFLLNTYFLLTLNVPHSQTLKILKVSGRLAGIPHNKFRKAALKLKDMGFNLESSYFLSALSALCSATDSTWKSRCMLFRSFGFSDDEIVSMFKKLPLIMRYKENHINKKMEFFLKKLQWMPSKLLTNPGVLSYSLEKRTIPRCSVLQVLVLKNSTSESYDLSTILQMTDRKFIEDFVTVRKDELPEVIEAYQGKLKFDEYTFRPKGQLNLKPSLNS